VTSVIRSLQCRFSVFKRLGGAEGSEVIFLNVTGVKEDIALIYARVKLCWRQAWLI
jgi:hypothetical protein